MSTLNVYRALLAANQHRAVQKASRRHVHIASRPLVVVGYHLAGDIGAPLALMWGTDQHTTPQIITIPEPRDRQLRFDALKVFGEALVEYLSGFNEMALQQIGRGQSEATCIDAPQIVVPNQATADWLFGIVGRFTRNLRTDVSPAAPAIVSVAGKHLSFFHDLLPGSSLVLPATEILKTHWQTGQLPSEDLNLSALLGWIIPGEGWDGPTAARHGENLPPAGPVSDPNWDANVLSNLNSQWHKASAGDVKTAVRGELEIEIRNQLDHTWADCWQAIDLISALPEGERVAHRWGADCQSWTRHNVQMQAGEARFRNVPTPIQSARTLSTLERKTKELETEMALDDPLVMANYIAKGEALSGRVAAVDANRKIPGPTGRQVRRPLVTLEPLIPFTRPPGTKLFLASAPKVELEVISTTPELVLAQVISGALTAKTSHHLPSVGDEVVLSPFGKSDWYPSPEYDEVPWTHQVPELMEEQHQ
ncbi:MAG: hypothetical protein N0E54_17285 [Candidatus Thiodiazotropha taylori]|nr:hypothetical protein [Candidatus Thiodiazotropha endolucinida]MCW4230497.1 hypothetical protein [Candidatus Thiodiazotropha taylori]